MRARGQQLAPRFVGASTFTTAIPAGAVSYYSDAKSQLSQIYNLTSGFAAAWAHGSSLPAVQALIAAVAAFQNDVANFNAVDKAAVTASPVYSAFLAASPTAADLSTSTYTSDLADQLQLNTITLQSMLSAMPSVTAAQVTTTNNQTSQERFATTRQTAPNTVAQAGYTIPQSASPTTVIITAGAPTPTPFPWDLVFAGAAVAGALYFLLEKKR